MLKITTTKLLTRGFGCDGIHPASCVYNFTRATIQQPRRLTDEELLRFADSQLDSLTTTELERELVKRMGPLLDAKDDDLIEAAAEFDFEAKNLKALGDALIQNTDNTVALLAAICEAGIDTPDDLKVELDLAKQFRSLASDAGDLFSRLTELTTTTQEQ